MLQPCGEHPTCWAADALLQGTGWGRSASQGLHIFPCTETSDYFAFIFLKLSQVSEDVPVSLSFRGKGYALKVAYDSSVDLVLAAASEYFNSSATLKDPCMDLAR